MKQISNVVLLALLLVMTYACGSKSKNENAEVITPPANNIIANEPKVIEYAFTNQAFEPFDIIGKIYNLPSDPTVARKKILENRASFLKADYYAEVKPEEDKLYQVFYEYQPTGFKVLIGYKGNSTSIIPKGCIKMSTPRGQFGVFPFPNQADSTYYQTWGIVEAASKEFRSYQGDVEVFNLDKASATAAISEVRVHLK
jgi:predicted transcriptional regulator YdeE